MAREKRSFFEKLTGGVNLDEYDDAFEEEVDVPIEQTPGGEHDGGELAYEEEAVDGQLTVDVYQTSDAIVIKAIVAGVKPDDLDVSITRDMVTIKGRREESSEAAGDDYFYQELYWGSFSRTILLPQEIDTDAAEANEKNGILTINLPKIDKDRQTKLKVKGS